MTRTRLRDRSLNAGSFRIDLGKFLGLFLFSPSHQGEVLLLRANRHGTARMADRLRTARSRRAYLAIFRRELDLDHLIGPVVNSRSPTEAFVSFWTRGLLGFPIDEKVVGIEAGRLPGLPLMIP